VYNTNLEKLKIKLASNDTYPIPVYKFEYYERTKYTYVIGPGKFLTFYMSHNNNNNIYIHLPLQKEHSAGQEIGSEGYYENLLKHIPGFANYILIEIYNTFNHDKIYKQSIDFYEKLCNDIKNILDKKNLYITGDSYGGLLAVHILFIYKYFYKIQKIHASIFGGLNGLPSIVYNTFKNLDDHILYFCYKYDKIIAIKIATIDITSPLNIVYFDIIKDDSFKFTFNRPGERINVNLGNTVLTLAKEGLITGPQLLYNKVVPDNEKVNVYSYFASNGGHYLSGHEHTKTAYQNFIELVVDNTVNTHNINNYIKQNNKQSSIFSLWN